MGHHLEAVHAPTDVRRATRMKMLGAVLATTVALGAAAAPAGAQNQTGLVNVNIEDVAVTVPITAAANICGVNVVVLATELAQGPVNCTSRAGQDVTVTQR